MALIPKPTAALGDVVGGRILIAREWFDYLRQLSVSGDSSALRAELERIALQVKGLEGSSSGQIIGSDEIIVNGVLSNGYVQLSLAELPDTGGGELLKILRDEFGRVAGSSAAVLVDLADVSGTPALGNALQWTGTQWEPKSIEAGVNNLDGGQANSVYGGTTAINGGGA